MPVPLVPFRLEWEACAYPFPVCDSTNGMMIGRLGVAVGLAAIDGGQQRSVFGGPILPDYHVDEWYIAEFVVES